MAVSPIETRPRFRSVRTWDSPSRVAAPDGVDSRHSLEASRGLPGNRRANSGGLAVVAPFCIGIDRALWLGSVLFLVVMGTAGVFQAWAGPGQRVVETVHDAPSAGSGWRRGIVIASTLLVIPAALLSYLTAAIPRLVMRVGALASGSRLSPEVTQEASATIANQTVMVVLVSVALAAILVMFAIANLFAARSRAALDPLDRYSWVVLAGVGVWVAWSLVRLSTDLTSFQAALR